jgi:murein DD-endopeptidase MepM/ murein hydrolase activator NlpD
LWENNLNAYSLIRPGDKLAILPVSGITYEVARGETMGAIANKYQVDEKEIIKTNKISDSGKLMAGQKLIIPGARKDSYVKKEVKRYSSVDAIKDLVKSPSAKPVAGNKMNWPTAGYRITQYYTWKHHAVDIANKIGTPIYAADAGVVEYAGWGKGYGNQIVIDHGGGKKTRYAHMTKFHVKKGESIAKGQSIGGMGSTGWSTGPHLHFEVMINGVKYNPLNYIK